MKDVIRFWVDDMGIDGFRMDAVPYMFEDTQFKDEPLTNQTLDSDDYNYLDHIYTFNLPEHYDMISQFYQVMKEYELIDGHHRYAFILNFRKTMLKLGLLALWPPPAS